MKFKKTVIIAVFIAGLMPAQTTPMEEKKNDGEGKKAKSCSLIAAASRVFFRLKYWWTQDKNEALLDSVYNNDSAMMQELFMAGASIDNKAGDEALRFAIFDGNRDMIRRLLAARANIYVNNIPYGGTALTYAVVTGSNIAVIRELLAARANVDVSYQRYTPLRTAAINSISSDYKEEYSEIVKELLKAGAQISQSTWNNFLYSDQRQALLNEYQVAARDALTKHVVGDNDVQKSVLPFPIAGGHIGMFNMVTDYLPEPTLADINDMQAVKRKDLLTQHAAQAQGQQACPACHPTAAAGLAHRSGCPGIQQPAAAGSSGSSSSSSNYCAVCGVNIASGQAHKMMCSEG
ncbi:MAG: ankyrin repeat domain-containing protein [Candidatus Dependentiae bacterium]|nr:ankyrin repeat domain-containing protein [Candidatus Dependentiae bacterium]